MCIRDRSDGELELAAKQTAAQYKSALNLFRQRKYDPPNFPQVMPISSLTSLGLAQVWSTIEELVLWRKQKGYFYDIRKSQKVASFNRELNNVFQEKMQNSQTIANEIKTIKIEIHNGTITPELAAENLLKKIIV